MVLSTIDQILSAVSYKLPVLQSLAGDHLPQKQTLIPGVKVNYTAQHMKKKNENSSEMKLLRQILIRS